MSLAPCRPDITTVAGLPAEDVVILPSNTAWNVPWQLMMLGPFVSCGLVDGELIRHVTVPSMVASAVRRGSTPEAPLVGLDYLPMPVFAAEMPLLDAAVLVAETGWELAVVIDREPRVITARSVYRALLASGPGSTTGSIPLGPSTSSVAGPLVECTAPTASRR